MFSDIDSLLDQVVQVLWNLWGQAILLQDSENFVTSDTFDLWNAIVISQDYTDLRGGTTFFG
jgi:hypothetical protein